MWLILLSLVAGIILGAANIIADSWFKHLDKGITITLFVMLVALGAQIGINAELLANLPLLGWRAAVIAVLSIGGSVGALWLVACRWTAYAEREEA